MHKVHREKAKVGILLRLPTPYRDPIFEHMACLEHFDIEVLYCSRTQPGRDWKPDWLDGFKYEFLPGSQILLPLASRFAYKINPTIWRKLTRAKYDVVVMSGYADLTMQLAVLWCWVHQTSYVLMSETHLLNRRDWVKRFIKALIVKPIISKAAAYLPTGTNAKEYLQYYGADPNKTFFFPNTPDVAHFKRESECYKADRSQLREALGIRSENFIVLYVGRLAPEKGILYLLEAFSRLKSDMPGVSLVLVGDGPLRKKVEGFVQKHKLQDVHFVGFVDYKALPKWYAISDVFVLPSLYEPWGVVVNEAMACGLPVIATRMVGSTRDLIMIGENGFIVKERDPDELCKAILQVFEDRSTAQQMGQRSQEIIQQWDYRLCVQSFIQAIKVTLGNA